MLSRVANAIYWMSRYIERAENIARIIDVNLYLNLDMTADMDKQWDPLVWITADNEWFNEHYGIANEENVIRFLTYDTNYHNSIISCLYQARENARSIREIITSDMWEQINRTYLFIKDMVDHNTIPESAYDFFRRLRMSCHLFTGLMDATMSRGEQWHFARMGQLLERADQTTRIIDIKYFRLLPTAQDIGTPLDNSQWAALLKSASALDMYRQKMHRIDHYQVANFLIFDHDFPRAIYFCLFNAEMSLHAITGVDLMNGSKADELEICRLRAKFDQLNIDAILNNGLHQFIDDTQLALIKIGNEIYETFFSVR